MEHTKELLFKMADDALIIGHRNSEWTGLAPTLEEDISFSSMAQDKVGHAYNLYHILNEKLNEKDPDTLAFKREEKEFKCCHLVEHPINEFDFSLVRQFLFDHAEHARYIALTESSFEPLANLAKKIKGEIKYHVIHADTWLVKLGNGSDESHSRMQQTLDKAFPMALGIFEPGNFEDKLIREKIFIGEKALQEQWLKNITPVVERANLKIPEVKKVEAAYGGRKGFHTEYLKPLLEEMTEVLRIEPEAEW